MDDRDEVNSAYNFLNCNLEATRIDIDRYLICLLADAYKYCSRTFFLYTYPVPPISAVNELMLILEE